MKKYLIVGNGVAGTTAAENIRKLDPTGLITIITEEEIPYYYRIRLNDYISGQIDRDALIARKTNWYEENKIKLVLGARVVDANAGQRWILTEKKEKYSYDTLLLASGSHSFVPPIEGVEKKGVFTLRNFADAERIMDHLAKSKNCVLIGGGLLGLEAGNALIAKGQKVMVVEFFPQLLPRQLDAQGAIRLKIIMEDMGFSFRTGAKTEKIVGTQSVKQVLLEGGERLGADTVIISAGVRPNLELAKSLGLECNKGVLVNQAMQSNSAEIYAAGDVAEFNQTLYGIWPAALQQGKIAGINMAGGKEKYGGTTMANKLKVVGIDLASAGLIDGKDNDESKVVETDKVYRKFIIKDDRLVGCIMIGDTSNFVAMTKKIDEQVHVAAEELF